MGSKINKNSKSNVFFWQLYAIVYDCISFLPPYQKMLRDVEKTSEIKPTNTVLDVGCGSGNFIYHMINHHCKAKFVGCDISESMLMRAKNKINDPSVVFEINDINNELPFSSNYFDRIIAINSLYATENPCNTMAELLRVLKPGGMLVIVNPHSKAKFKTTYLQILNSGKGIKKVFIFLVTLPLFLFNLFIKIKASKQSYHFLSRKEWKDIADKLGVRTFKIDKTYIQSFLVTIIK